MRMEAEGGMGMGETMEVTTVGVNAMTGFGFAIRVDVGADGKVRCHVEGAEGAEETARRSWPLPGKLVERIHRIIDRAAGGGATKSHILRAAQPYKVDEVNAALARLVETHRIEGGYASDLSPSGRPKMIYRVIAPKLAVELWDEE